ncbi:class I mannose-6-phosphate isomerase [Pseudopontixanthobacter vadosimaris]|uniref:class I mannose-6-phosphate isomerase n=1 Tax=Pseudopontixanthobacter vadosimaris TaxID=2726450 RepID=UPI001475D86A|nr:class I mannose-6-phosphate isomerase [Pseudopontixanthobacter vadosimaris]
MNALLPVREVAKVWGRKQLPAPFGKSCAEAIGEIWFEPPPEAQELLVKYIFTSEKLSIQTHPDDDQAEAAGQGRQGKEECWLVLDAEEGARLGIGFHEPITADRMRAAALDGSIEDLLVWHEVSAGDFFYIPAGTVHAIGSGISLIEIQQNSDITYRLYDYGRPRELHLDAGVEVAHGMPYDPALHRHIGAKEQARLVNGPHFLLDQIVGTPGDDILTDYSRPCLVIPVSGTVGIGGVPVRAGNCALAESLASVDFTQAERTLVTRPQGT